jgi:hypothetical protein
MLSIKRDATFMHASIQRREPSPRSWLFEANFENRKPRSDPDLWCFPQICDLRVELSRRSRPSVEACVRSLYFWGEEAGIVA